MTTAGDPAAPSAAHAAALGTEVEVAYTNYTNVDARFSGPYQPGDRLVRGYSGRIDVRSGEPIEDIAERLFARHNRDDRPDGQLCPSMSVGDVVVVAEVAVSVDSCGWLRVQPRQEDIINDRPWRAVVEERPVAATRDAASDIVNGWATPPPVSPAPFAVDGIEP